MKAFIIKSIRRAYFSFCFQHKMKMIKNQTVGIHFKIRDQVQFSFFKKIIAIFIVKKDKVRINPYIEYMIIQICL